MAETKPNAVVAAAKDPRTSIVGAVTLAASQIVPLVVPPDWIAAGLQIVAALSGVALVIFARDAST